MKISMLYCGALSICAAAMLAGCGASQPPIGGPATMPQASAIATHADRGTSWMAPEAKNKDLLYVSGGVDDVYVLAYPTGKLVGTLTGFDVALGLCSDAAGDVFVTNYGFEGSLPPETLEYAHAGTVPIATYSDPNSGPDGCAVDPTTGNLAVVNYYSPPSGEGNVVIYPYGSGMPEEYWDSDFRNMLFCGYDASGNLFADGINNQSLGFAFAELPSGGSSMETITVNQTIKEADAVQWDGSYITIQSSAKDANAIYRLTISGSEATVVDFPAAGRGLSELHRRDRS